MQTINSNTDALAALTDARRALTDSLAQRERALARIRRAEQTVAHAEAAAGDAEDAVLVGEAADSTLETRCLADARAALDAARQSGARAERAIADATAAVRDAEYAAHCTTAAESLVASLEGVPALQAAITELVTRYTQVLESHSAGRRALVSLVPSQGDLYPAFDLAQWVATALKNEGLNLFTVNMNLDGTGFDLTQVAHDVTANLQHHVQVMRRQGPQPSRLAA